MQVLAAQQFVSQIIGHEKGKDALAIFLLWLLKFQFHFLVAVDISRGADSGTNRDYKSRACGYRTYNLCCALFLLPGSNVFSKYRLRIRTRRQGVNCSYTCLCSYILDVNHFFYFAHWGGQIFFPFKSDMVMWGFPE